MAAQINLSEFFDFSDKSQIDEFLRLANELKTGYGSAIKEITKDLKEGKAIINSYTKALESQEKALKGLSAATKEGQEGIAKADAVVQNAVKGIAAMRQEETKLKQTRADNIKSVNELSKATKNYNDNVGKSKKLTDAAAGSIDDLKNKVNQAKKAYESLGSDIDPFIKTRALENYQRYKAQLTEASAALKTTKQDAEVAAGSYEALDREVKQLEKDYKKLPDILGKNKAAAAALAKELDRKRQTLKNLDAGIGNYQRNVGNYALALKDAALNTGLFGGQISALANNFQSVQNSLGGVTKGIGGLKAAIIGSGIGALLIGLGAVATFFKATDSGSELLERKLSGLSAVVENLKGRFAELGSSIVQAFTGGGGEQNNPQSTAQNLATTIRDQLQNRLEAFANSAKAIAKGDIRAFNNAMLQMATGIKDAGDRLAQVGTELDKVKESAEATTKALQELDDQERIFGITSTKNRGIVDQLVKSARDLTQARGQRLENLDRASNIEIADSQRALELAKRNLDIILEINSRRTNFQLSTDQVAELTQSQEALEKFEKFRRTLSDDDLNRQAEAQKKLIELENQSVLKQQEIQNRRSQLLKQIAEEEFSALKERNEKIIKQSDNLNDLQEKRLKDFNVTVLDGKAETEAKLTQLEIEGNAKRLEEFRKSEEQKTLIKERQDELRRDLEQTAVDTAVELANIPFENTRIKREEEAEQLEQQRDFELSLVGDNKAAQDRINREFDRKQRDLKRKQAQDDKKQALFNIGIQTAIAIIRQLATTPLPLGAPLVALIAATGVIQAAAVAARPIPAFAKGTENAPEGLAIVDEQGPEAIERNGKIYMGQSSGPRLTYLKRGDKVYTAKETAEMASVNNALYSYQDGLERITRVKDRPAIEYDKISSPIVSAIKDKKHVSISVGKRGIQAMITDRNNKLEIISNNYNLSI